MNNMERMNVSTQPISSFEGRFEEQTLNRIYNQAILVNRFSILLHYKCIYVQRKNSI